MDFSGGLGQMSSPQISSLMSEAQNRRRAVILSWSPIADDPRVRRMGDRLHAGGWRVTGIGHAGARSAPPAWPIRETSPFSPPRRDRDPLALLERAAGRAGAFALLPAERAAAAFRPETERRLSRIRAMLMNHNRPLTRSATLGVEKIRRFAERGAPLLQRSLRQFHRLAPQLAEFEDMARAEAGPALFIANDWWTLPAAAAGVDAQGGALVYDSHELASEEYAQDPDWRGHHKPIIDAIEGHFIRRAAFVTSVSPGITAALKSIYSLEVATGTLRNAPLYRETPFRPVGERIRVLYHGLVAEGRGLETAIRSVAAWREEFSLHIRGPAVAPDYLDGLKRLAGRAAGERVVFHDPVPVEELVRAAAPFDIGLMALPGHSEQNRHALPNKLFEYLMAGLALAVTDLPEMARLVRETNAGVTFADGAPEAIAAAINGLARPALDDMRRRALEAAKIYNFERESPSVIAAYERIYDACAQKAA